jgi:hypothetical protein
MKRFKIIDLWVNILLISGSLVYGIAVHNQNSLVGYFVVGGWQLISMFVHFAKDWFFVRGSKRYVYEWTVLLLIFCVVTGFFLPPLLFAALGILLFAAPIMAIYYTWICYEEVYVKMQRPLALLK